jgi:hypothetical protein
MLYKTNFTVSLTDIEDSHSDNLKEGKTSINEPSGNFFYDPWRIKKEYQGTVWEKILSTLKFPIGEARIIVLKRGTCYLRHADIDDRYHLNISGDNSYLVDLEKTVMHELKRDGFWYKMHAGILHTAINVGEHDRIQLVVRDLLNRNTVLNPVSVKITGSGHNLRFVFDGVYSTWLNIANKKGIIGNFKHDGDSATFDVNGDHLEELTALTPKGFAMEIV